MAAVQGGLVDAVEKKDIKTEPSEDSGGNNNANDGRLLSPPPGSSASAPGGNKPPAGAPEDQQTLLAVLQFLRKNNLAESVEILRREAGLPEDALDLKAGDSAGAGSGGAGGTVDLEGEDASSLLSRVTVSSSAAAQAPTKGRTGLLLFGSVKYCTTKFPVTVTQRASGHKYCNYHKTTAELILLYF